jgi:hypothetical protein
MVDMAAATVADSVLAAAVAGIDVPARRHEVNHETRLQYVGFKTNGTFREYTFSVLDSQRESREYTVTIANEAFNSHRARFQDGPDICSLRLQRELATGAESPLESTYEITDADLEDYRIAHSPKPGHRGFRPPKTS